MAMFRLRAPKKKEPMFASNIAPLYHEMDARQRVGTYICQCGAPVPASELLHEFLKGVDREATLEDIQRYCNIDKASVYLIAYLLDDLNLTSHDVSVRTPHLTKRGELLLEALQAAQQFDYDFDLMEDSEDDKS